MGWFEHLLYHHNNELAPSLTFFTITITIHSTGELSGDDQHSDYPLSHHGLSSTHHPSCIILPLTIIHISFYSISKFSSHHHHQTDNDYDCNNDNNDDHRWQSSHSAHPIGALLSALSLLDSLLVRAPFSLISLCVLFVFSSSLS